MNDLLHRIEKLEQQIQEKENELQLLKDDLEAIRAALETALEEQQDSVAPEPKASTAPEKVEHPETSQAQEPEDQEAEKEDKPVSKEQQHEAIMRTIEEFSKEQKPSRSSKIDLGEKLTLGDRASQKHLKDLKKAFGINERFLYSNELFNGDMSAFTRAIEELNHLESLDDAERLLEENLAPKYKWDDESDTVAAFKSMVSRRFA